MVDEETLGKVREAFYRVQRDGDLRGWGLDDKVISPFLQESGSAKLTVSLLRGATERTSVVIDPAAVRQREGEVTVSALAEEISRALREQGILAD
jgi:hypothetical protein